MTMLDAALKYLEMEWPVFPVLLTGTDKKPLVAWKRFQNELPTADEVRAWWTKWPNAGIGVATGKLAGFFAVDLDRYKQNFNEEKALALIPDNLNTPTTQTLRGGNHLLLAMPEDFEVRNSASEIEPGIDIRGEGGYIVLPPSSNGTGVYKWLISPDEVRPAACPPALINIILNIYKSAEVNGLPKTSLTSSDFRFFTQGRRDEDIFHAANLMVKGGGEIPFVEKALELLALQCNPPFALSETQAKIKSALQRAERRDRNIAAEVREWVLTSDGFFLTSDCFRELGLTSRDFQKAATLAMLKLAKAGVIEKYGNKRGCYRLVDKSIEFLDILAPTKTEFDIELPLGLSDHARLHEKNPIVFAGSKDAGKTLLAMEATRLNIGKYPILYMTSEMGADELTKRLALFQNMTLEKWHKGVKFVYRSHDWADLVTSDYGLIVIDYVEPPEDKLYMVGQMLRAVHDKLTNNVALVCIQKKRGEDLGRGNQFTLDKARLYVALDAGNSQTPNRAKIVSCKSFKRQNPRGMVLDYKVFGGWEIKPQGYWKHENN